ncbi:MAG TPA: hypothetical protein VGY30_02725 [Solirubrobacteraceae bacterium]|jgi:hypothetical protein|nr:hypothetical protein [Solirubrobacteraceae bacterium]
MPGPSARTAPRRPTRSAARVAKPRVAALLAGALVACSGCQESTRPHATSQQPRQQQALATITAAVEPDHPGPRVPRDFLGLSFEASSLPLIAHYGSHGDLARMLRSLGQGLLRFGGVSADTQAAWSDAQTSRAPWASTTIDEADLLGLRRLARASGWRIVLTVGLAHFEPRAAARETAAAERALGPLLAGVELGNEPDAYGRHRLRAQPWTLARYDADVTAYRRAIAELAPRVPLFGPDLSGSLIFKRWGAAYAHTQQPTVLTGHHYPLGCRQIPRPSIARLLSEPTRQAEDQSLDRYMAVARRARIPFRLDETGSVSCGGTAGISDTFAATLWALDYIGHAIQAGVAGVNFEGNPARCTGYTALCATSAAALARGVLSARPEWYALLAARSLIGERPIGVARTGAQANVDVLATIGARRTLHVLIVDDAGPSARDGLLSLRLPGGYAYASALSLSAAAAAATSVRFGGRAVGPDGFWQGPSRQPLPVTRDRLTLALAPSSAMLLTVHAGR